MIRYILAYTLTLLLCSGADAQTLTGKITDTAGTPVEGALVQNITQNTHAHTDRYGAFLLDHVSAGDSIEVSHPGYANFYLAVTKFQNLHIALKVKAFELGQVTITAGLRHLNTLSAIDIETQPVHTSQELLRKVPGLFIGQHAGGGKAEQIFLRGFDIDHGTDINITVDGMPVNMVSHAHGQGYADLHFLIPETVEEIDFDKGPYFAEKGDFTTAGYVAFKTKDRLESSLVSAEIGQFNTLRGLGMFNLLNSERQSAYFAGEYMLTDNYFKAPQNFNRNNLFGKYTARLSPGDRISLSVSHFKSSWDASGQIPERAVASGLISYFGAIDSTEGGNTSRSNFNLQYDKKISENAWIKNTAYFSHYDFELFSNFTFFLNDPDNGDQIKQKESRNITGMQTEYHERVSERLTYKAGAGLRSDYTRGTELSHTLNRSVIIDRLSFGDISQANLYAYAAADYTAGKWLINAGARIDYFKFGYIDLLQPVYANQSKTKAIVSPKLNFLYSAGPGLNVFLKLGKGFHSNDTRVVIPRNGKEILPAAYGSDLGAIWKPFPRMVINGALWYLFLEQEFIYVGDEAVVEPGGRTARKGIDAGIRYQLADKVFWNADATYTHARAIDEPKGEDYLPLAPVFTFTTGWSIKDLNRFSGSLKARYLGNRPANEDYSVTARGYLVTDFSLSYRYRKTSLGISIDNLLNTKWKETQFLTESRLQNEPAPVEEIHFTPGTPFNARLVVRYSF
ncbi:TonB-dependent receptor [Leadbetterella sp. DM7]|uniref:TonB-dependent receptor n=1 Tax=Leadbetterella sp. DM7 TaxID=3235085 RepID=UPI00349EC0FE